MKMTNKTYDVMKWIAWIYAPLITLVTALVNVWFFDSRNFERIISTLTAIDTFLGIIVGYSNAVYNGEMENKNDE